MAIYCNLQKVLFVLSVLTSVCVHENMLRCNVSFLLVFIVYAILMRKKNELSKKKLKN